MRFSYATGGLLLFLLVAAVVGASTLNISNGGSVVGLTGQWFDYVVVIMLENHSINYTYYNGIGTNPCFGNCTYFTSLANANGLAENYRNTGVTGGSIGDYIAITSGYGNTSSDCNAGPMTTGCPLLGVPNIVDRLELAGLSWKIYMEGYPIQSGCYNTSGGYPGYYAPEHNPFIYYSDFQHNMTRCSRIVAANSANIQPNIPKPRCYPIPVDNDSLFLNDLGSITSASNYMFLIPNTIDDIHDCDDVSVGNSWLQQIVPQILNSFLFLTHRSALFITFDEPDCTFGTCPSAAPELYSVWVSNSTSSRPTVVPHVKSNAVFTHYSQLKTIEDNWHLPYLISTTDGSPNTRNMQVFFR
jgi:hypothetical protein